MDVAFLFSVCIYTERNKFSIFFQMVVICLWEMYSKAVDRMLVGEPMAYILAIGTTRAEQIPQRFSLRTTYKDL